MPRSFLVKSKKTHTYNLHRYEKHDPVTSLEPSTVPDSMALLPSPPEEDMPPVNWQRLEYPYIKQEGSPKGGVTVEEHPSEGLPPYCSPVPPMQKLPSPPYYKPSFPWDSLHAAYDFRQLSCNFQSSLLQRASSLYGTRMKETPKPQQPLDYSTHYSPSSDTYHCITCNKCQRLNSLPRAEGTGHTGYSLQIQDSIIRAHADGGSSGSKVGTANLL
ncbi:UNVERIFIED_CONTAM: hypothetical protein FKN15_001599 [Acipenser sinensis]